MKRLSKYSCERQKLKNNPRKILSLEERVQALRMFEQTPVYQRIASTFQCSWEQIKNIVANRDDILSYYARCQTISSTDHPSQIRKKKIIFLGNVVFEFIKRAFYHKSASLNEDSIRAKALEFRNIIEIDQFFPNRAWFYDFKRIFNINLPNPKTIVLTREPPRSLDCQVIINDCRREIQRNLRKGHNKKPKGKEKIVENENVTEMEKNPKTTKNETNPEEDVNDNEEGLTIDFSSFEVVSHAEQKSLKNPKPKPEEKLKDEVQKNRSISKTPLLEHIKEEPSSTSTHTILAGKICDTDTALNHLIPLEDFALGEEDFIAINLISKLSEHFRKNKRRAKRPKRI